MEENRLDLKFWKFLIVFSVVLNALNFYFIVGLYNVADSGSSDVFVSNTALGNFTGYFVLGSPALAGLLFIIVMIAGYFVFRR